MLNFNGWNIAGGRPRRPARAYALRMLYIRHCGVRGEEIERLKEKMASWLPTIDCRETRHEEPFMRRFLVATLLSIGLLVGRALA